MKVVYKYILVLIDGSIHIVMSEYADLPIRIIGKSLIPVMHGSAQLKFDNNTGKLLKPSQALYPHEEGIGWEKYEFAKDAFQSRLYFGITPQMGYAYMKERGIPLT